MKINLQKSTPNLFSLNYKPVIHKNSYSTTSVLTATTLVYAIGAGITAAAGTRLALQWILDREGLKPAHCEPPHVLEDMRGR